MTQAPVPFTGAILSHPSLTACVSLPEVARQERCTCSRSKSTSCIGRITLYERPLHLLVSLCFSASEPVDKMPAHPDTLEVAAQEVFEMDRGNTHRNRRVVAPRHGLTNDELREYIESLPEPHEVHEGETPQRLYRRLFGPPRPSAVPIGDPAQANDHGPLIGTECAAAAQPAEARSADLGGCHGDAGEIHTYVAGGWRGEANAGESCTWTWPEQHFGGVCRGMRWERVVDARGGVRGERVVDARGGVRG